MSTITFGRYTPYSTPIHRLDPRNKLFFAIAFIVVVFLRFTVWSTAIFFSLVYLILLLCLMVAAKVSFLELFKSLKGMWFLVLFLLVVYIFIPNSSYTGPIAFYIGQMAIYWEAFYQAGYIIMRLVLMISMMMVLTSSTKPMDLTYAFEWYMTPLKYIKFPVHEISMTLSIALRFIPTLLDEIDRIMKAQTSRGVDFNKGKLSKRFKAIISIIIPLFVSAIERSEELSNAMESRGYDPKGKRTRYRILRFSWADLVAIIISLIFVGGIITLFAIDKNSGQSLNICKILFGWELPF